MEKNKDKIKVILLGIIFFLLVAACWLKSPDDFSNSERRTLAQKPEVSLEAVLNGQFMSEFESYALDQFPFREQFRAAKALSEYGLFLKKDNNDIYIKDGYAAQILYPLNENSVRNATDHFEEIYNSFLKEQGSEVFVSVVPDKSYFLAERGGYPALDYQRLFELVETEMDYAKFIDLTDSLALEDYYKTDTHWRQERLLPAAQLLGQAMGLNMDYLQDLEQKLGKDDFRGVYYGQSALPLPAEPLYYLTDETLENCSVFNFETNETGSVYVSEKLDARDPYDFFLSGAAALLTVENPHAKTDRELILFRDSFGSSIAPLLIENYKTVTIVDIRYVQTDYLGQLLDFHGQDVLFLYGAAMLNDSYTFK